VKTKGALQRQKYCFFTGGLERRVSDMISLRTEWWYGPMQLTV